MVVVLIQLIDMFDIFCRSSLNTQNETSGAYLLGAKASAIGSGNIEGPIRPPTSTENLHGSNGLSGSSSSPSLLTSSNNHLGIGSSGILNESTIEGKSTQIKITYSSIPCKIVTKHLY